MSVGVFVGSFDPFTMGHLEVVEKALKICDVLVVGIGDNENKQRTFDKDKMLQGICDVLRNKINDGKVRVCSYSGLTGEFAKQVNGDFFVRGIRNVQDYLYEEKLAGFNQLLYEIDTIYIRADKYPLLSSTMVKNLLKTDRDVSLYLPYRIYEIVKEL